MNTSSALPTGACPASAVVMAASAAKTPLAIAQACAGGPSIMFVNAAFAQLLGSDASSWTGRPLSALAAPAAIHFAAGTTTRFEATLDGDRRVPLALSIAAVPDGEGAPFCLLCSLVDARGDGADEAIARDARMLGQVALAAGELMSEAAIVARRSASAGIPENADGIALEAVKRSAPSNHGMSS